VGIVDRKGYHESVDAAVRVLEGKTDKLVAELRKGMEDSSEREEFEAAASYRDQIRNLELITETQAVVEAGKARDRDVVGLARKEAEAHGTVLMIRAGKLVAVRHYHLQNTDASIPESQVLFDFLSQYYLAGAGKAVEEAAEGEGAKVAGASEVLLPAAPEDSDLLERAIGVGVRVAESSVDEQLLNVARSNAQYALEQSSRRAQGHGIQALEDVQKKLHLAKLPQRIECYDISNTQGTESVASRVVFIDGAPDKNLYRRYKIRTVEGANDFASMREVLGRRFSTDKPEVEALPDLVVVDGGKGQLAQAVAILDELNVQGVDVVGLAKARTERDFQSSEVKASQERIFIPGRKNPVPLYSHTDAYKLLVHVRDEAHRFAVSYHRLLRSKRTFAEFD
jgi:excinuclease ABC subunit C